MTAGAAIIRSPLMRVAVGLATLGLLGAAPVGSPRLPTATETPAAGRGPRLVFAEATFDFGRIRAGDVARHEFVFTNAGDRVLEIHKLVPGCGCTTATAPQQSVAPGKTGTIPVEFNSRGLNGLISRPITVMANDPTQSNVVLRLRADIWTPVELQPSVLVFNHSLDDPKRETKVLRIINHLGDPVAVSIDGWTNRSFEAALKTVRPGQEFALEITAVPPLGTGTVILPLKLTTSAPEVPSLVAKVCAIEQPPVVVAPKHLILPEGPLAAPERRAVSIRNLGSQPLALSGLEVDLAGVEPEVHEIQPGRLFSIVVTFPAGFQPPTGQPGQLRIRSDHPRFPVIGFPLIRAALAQTAQAQPRSATPSPASVSPTLQ